MLNSHSLDDALSALGATRSDVGKTIKFTTTGGPVFYVKKSKTEKPVKRRPLFFSPQLVEKRPAIDDISGIDVFWEGHGNSSLREYPKRLMNGEEPEHFGIDASIADITTLRSLIALAESGSHSIEPTAIDEIEQADQALSSEQTTRKALIDARLGQGKFRKSLIGYWGGCAVTGLANLAMLRASHAKPWRASTNDERLDVYNGLLLTANLDAALDAGLITFEETGAIRISRHFADAAAFGISSDMRLRRLEPAHSRYLEHHREQVFEQ